MWTWTSRWTYSKEDQWAEANELDQVLAVTLNGESIDDILSMTVKDQNQATPGIALDPIRDHLGSVHGWTEGSSGSIVHKQSYSAYGETTITNASGLLSQLGSQRGYTSRELDEDTNLYYYRARWYDQKTGRFLSEDPIGFSGNDLNLYRYGLSSPLGFSDPSGKITVATILLVTGGIINAANAYLIYIMEKDILSYTSKIDYNDSLINSLKANNYCNENDAKIISLMKVNAMLRAARSSIRSQQIGVIAGILVPLGLDPLSGYVISLLSTFY